MKSLTLNNNRKVPTLGLGTWRSDKKTVTHAIEKAITDYGYRHIDCASIYGNEKEIGKAFTRVFSSNPKLRNKVFITSKLWNTDHHPNNVESACRQTLDDLQLDYLDLYLIHWGIAFPHGGDLEPMGGDGLVKTAPVSTQQTWEAMEDLVRKGLVKSIGVANFTTAMLNDLLCYAKIKPVINQVEIHPYNTQKELVEYCHKQDIQITAYSPLGSSGDSKPKPIDDTAALKIAKKVGRTPAQILIRWALQRQLITIPKSTNLSNIKENSAVYDFVLSDADMNSLYKLNKNLKIVDPIEWWGVPYFR